MMIQAETGKDFLLSPAHPDVHVLCTSLTRKKPHEPAPARGVALSYHVTVEDDQFALPYQS